MTYNALRISMDQREIMDKTPINIESTICLEAITMNQRLRIYDLESTMWMDAWINLEPDEIPNIYACRSSEWFLCTNKVLCMTWWWQDGKEPLPMVKSQLKMAHKVKHS